MDFVTPEQISGLGAEEIGRRYGMKASGLVLVPVPWRPPFILLSSQTYVDWLAADRTFSDESEAALERVLPDIEAVLGSACMLRSSATDETIDERGNYRSFEVDLATGAANFLAKCGEIFEHYQAKGGCGEMCLILQVRVAPLRQGFLSNELRLVDKPYRWAVQSEIMAASGTVTQTTTLSAKQAPDFAVDDPLICPVVHEMNGRLRSVARHFWKDTKGRLLLEWCWDGSRLWIVQRDHSLERKGGVNPFRLLQKSAAVPTAESGSVFQRYQVGSSSPWNKLKKVANFGTGNTPPPHRLFYATAATLRAALEKRGGQGALAEEVDNLTGGRAVVRTDALEGGYNRHKTNTVTGTEAVLWIKRRLKAIRKDSEIVFILHAFIYARAAAWSYYKRGDPQVRVDGLWGLADGMQFYPFDTFLHFPKSKREIETTRFKSHVLVECDDGEWRVMDVAEQFARRRSLSKQEVADIAERTVEIAKRTDTDVQVMWFCGIPEQFGLGANLPWYMATPEQNIIEHRSHLLRSILVRDANDLPNLNQFAANSVKVILEPLGEDIRSDTFINLVAKACRRLSLPVEIRGSILSHAYHQLNKAGVQVFCAEPGKTALEIRQRKSFDKIVRDQIPEFIEEKGESVTAAQISSDELVEALIGKLLEEVTEFLTASSPASKIEELADILEVLRGLITSSGATMKDVEAKADKKREKRGGFERGIVLRSTTLQASEPEDALFKEIRTDHQSRVKLRDLADRGRRPDRATLPTEQLFANQIVQRTLEVGRQHVVIRAEMEAGNIILTLERVTDLSDRDQIDLLR